MSGRIGRYLLTILIILIVFLFNVRSSSAQVGFTVSLTVPDTSTFPHLTEYLDAHDPTGAFVHGLTPQDVTMQENELQVPVADLQEQKPGVQFVIAITPGASFSIRDTLGTSRYEYLLQGILTGKWVDQPAGEDDYSLLTVGGPQLIHTSDPALLKSSLETYKPNDPNATPNLEVLASALQVASDPTTRPGMERAILFITPPQDTNVSLGLQSIIASASHQNIRIYVWLVAAQEVFTLPEIDQLRNLANQTRAAFFAFSHDEPIPDLETLLEPLRYVYRLSYDTHVATAGSQHVIAQISIGTQLITTQPQSFDLNLQAPVLTIQNLPVEIVRKYSSPPTQATSEVTTDLLPMEEILTIQVTYPDGYDRPLTHTRLFVDGTVVAENTSPPFDQFVWDLRPYIQSGTHTLSIEATDSLGLNGKTGNTSVKITVPSTAQEVIVTFSQKLGLVIGVTVLVSASILVLALIVGGRIRPKPHPGQISASADYSEKAHRAGYREHLHLSRDPVSQPAKTTSSQSIKTKPRSKNWRELLPWFRRTEEPIHTMAYLVPLVGSDEPTLPAPLQITSDDITLGSDPYKSSLVIADPSIEGLHARIHHEDKLFVITDAGSVAGTWVNYERVSSQGTPLEHEDIVHLGMVSFRFKFSGAAQVREIVVTPLEPKL